MQHVVIVRQSGVVTFDRPSFEEVSAQLMRLVDADRPPDAIIGIRTGGLFVAEAMTRAVMRDVPVFPLTCRRAPSAIKSSRPFPRDLRLADRPLPNQRPPVATSQPYHFDNELAAIDQWIAHFRRAPYLLIVDDAVDSGATLSRAFNTVRSRTAPTVTIRSAAITVTTDRPVMFPDYALYHRQLCRFPWSLDALATAS